MKSLQRWIKSVSAQGQKIVDGDGYEVPIQRSSDIQYGIPIERSSDYQYETPVKRSSDDQEPSDDGYEVPIKERSDDQYEIPIKRSSYGQYEIPVKGSSDDQTPSDDGCEVPMKERSDGRFYSVSTKKSADDHSYEEIPMKNSSDNEYEVPVKGSSTAQEDLYDDVQHISDERKMTVDIDKNKSRRPPKTYSSTIRKFVQNPSSSVESARNTRGERKASNTSRKRSEAYNKGKYARQKSDNKVADIPEETEDSYDILKNGKTYIFFYLNFYVIVRFPVIPTLVISIYHQISLGANTNLLSRNLGNKNQ